MPKNIRAIKKRNELEPVTIHEAVADYLATPHVKRLSEKTQVNYQYFLGVFARFCAEHSIIQNQKTKVWSAVSGETYLHEVSDQVVHVFLEHLKATHKPAKASHEEMASWTLATYVKCIKTLLNWCLLDERYGQQVQAVAVGRIKKPKVEADIIEIFSTRQIEALFKACEREESEHLQMRDRAILALLLDTGIRETELVTLTIGNVSLESKDAYARVLGKGNKWGEVGLGEQSRRAIAKYIRMFRDPTIEYAFVQSQRNLSERQFLHAKKQAIASAPVFVNRYGKQLTPAGLYQIIVRLGGWAGIEGVRCSPHTLRHTFAVLFWRRTHDIRTLSKLLRHSSIAVTETYLRSILQSEARRGAPSVLDEL